MLGVVFIVLAAAALALVVYICTFTRTENIAHRRLKTDQSQQVAYRCVCGCVWREGGCVHVEGSMHRDPISANIHAHL